LARSIHNPAVAINLNPYQGLKPFHKKAKNDFASCNQPKSLSGIETTGPISQSSINKVAINLNPYQGLKLIEAFQEMCGECCNQPKSLSGIETSTPFLAGSSPAVAINLNPYQGLKLRAFQNRYV
jgi:hypothetical protein